MRDIKWQAVFDRTRTLLNAGIGRCATTGGRGREMKRPAETIVQGISLNRRGTVTVAPGHQQTLCDVAIALQGVCQYAVDVEHVVAALVMAVRDGRIERDSAISGDDELVIRVLQQYMPLLFEQLKGAVDSQQ